MITIEQGNEIRQAWYGMDGVSDRPHTVPECWDVIERLLQLIGDITGITNAAAISPDEPAVTDEVEDFDGTIRQYNRHTDTLVATIPAGTTVELTEQEPTALGGWTVPDDDDARGWHELAVQRAAAEGIDWPTLDEFKAFADVLNRNGITPDAVDAHIDAEQAGIDAGTIAPLRPRRRPRK